MLNQTKLRKAQNVLGTKTETETIEIALERIIGEAEKNQEAWLAHENFVEAAICENLVIEDVFGRLRA